MVAGGFASNPILWHGGRFCLGLRACFSGVSYNIIVINLSACRVVFLAVVWYGRERVYLSQPALRFLSGNSQETLRVEILLVLRILSGFSQVVFRILSGSGFSGNSQTSFRKLSGLDFRTFVRK